MSIVVTLADFTPLPREDGVAWTFVRIEEAAVVGGPWSLIDTQAISPVDAQPAYPATRTFTTVNAVLPSGWYRLTWFDGTNVSAPTPPVHNDFGESQGLRPTVGDVAALLRARTKVPGGKELGTFGSQTRPTAEEADSLIDEALMDVTGKIAPVTPDVGSDFERRAQACIRLYAACLIELSYFPEQVKSDRSAFESYWKLYEDRIESLISEARTGDGGGGGDGGGDGSGTAPADAAWSYPADDGGLIGWSSRW